MFTYRYPRPALTADCVVVAEADGKPALLLVERAREPFAGSWALPGGFVEMDEDLEDAARRELREETGIEAAELEQLGAYGAPGRDPRERVVTVAFLAVLRGPAPEAAAGDDARRARWFPLDALPPLAFDHGNIVADALRRIGAGSLFP